MNRHLDSVTISQDQLEQAKRELTQQQTQAIHRGLQILAGVCDRAATEDGAGFSKIDARIGHKLANQRYLTPGQAALGQRLCIKYRRQLGEKMMEQINPRKEQHD